MRISPMQIWRTCEFCKDWGHDQAAEELLTAANWENGYGVCRRESRSGIVKVHGFKVVAMRHYSQSTSRDCWQEDKVRSSIMTIMEHRWQGLEERVDLLETRIANLGQRQKRKSEITKKLEPRVPFQLK